MNQIRFTMVCIITFTSSLYWEQHLPRGHWFYCAKFCLLSHPYHISEIWTAISRITTEPGMFELNCLNWMHFSLWFQIRSWNSTILTFFYKICQIYDLSSVLACLRKLSSVDSMSKISELALRKLSSVSKHKSLL